MPVPTLRRRHIGLGVLTPVALIASSALVYQASSAAFTATTSNGPNTWSAGQVTLSDDDNASVMFNPTGLKPGSTDSRCINVTFTGNVASQVRLYFSGYTSNNLGKALTMTVEEGTGAGGGSSFDCTGFTGGTTISPNGSTLDSLAAANSAWNNGLSTWNPSATATKSYRFTYTLKDDNSANGLSAQANFVWEARNT